MDIGVVDDLAPGTELLNRAHAWLASSSDPTKPWDRKDFRPPEALGLLSPAIGGTLMASVGRASALGGNNQPAYQAILSVLFEGMQLPFDRALEIEAKYFAKLLTGPVALNILRTFVNKGTARGSSRRPAGIEPTKVAKVGVLGAGMMGSGIAAVSASVGIDVVLLDVDEATAQRGKDRIAQALAKDVQRNRRSPADVDAILGRIQPADNFQALFDVDLVVEAVFEDVGVKADTTRKAEAVMPAGGVFATNTSTLPIGQLAQASARPDQFIGLHFFSPVERMELVEVILGAQTSSATLARSLDFIAQIRKTPIIVNDSRGFYTSRVFQTFIHEGAAMRREGIPPAVIENAAVEAGFPVGPLALLDEVTLDLPLKIIDQSSAADARYVPPVGEPVHILTDGIASRASDIDIALVHGYAWPAWTGGAMFWADTVGIDRVVEGLDRMSRIHGSAYAPAPLLREAAATGAKLHNFGS